MPETSLSLLERLRTDPTEVAWRRLDELYRPLIHRWLVRLDTTLDHDADDLTQEILTAVFRELPTFERARTGSFRRWLRTIAVNRLRGFWRGRRRRPVSLDGRDVDGLLAQLEDPVSGPSRQWDEEHNQHVVQGLLKLIAVDFEAKTLEAFALVFFDGLSSAEAAARLQMSPTAVLSAKARVLARLRQEGRDLLD